MRIALVLLTLVVPGLPAPTQAQSRGPTDRGSMLVGGTANVSRSTSEVGDSESTSTGVSLNPMLLYFVAPRVAIGGQLGLSRLSYDDGSSSSWLLGPAARLYFGGSESRTLPFIGANFSLGGASSDSDVGNASFESDAWSIEGVAGLTWMVSRQVGITGEAFLQRIEIENEGPTSNVEQTRTEMGIRFGFAAFLFR